MDLSRELYLNYCLQCQCIDFYLFFNLIICGPRDHLRSNARTIFGLGIIWTLGSFAALYITPLSVPNKILAKKLIIRRISEGGPATKTRASRFFKGTSNSALNYVDFEEAFDSIHRQSLWRILRAYGIPQQIVLVIKSFYNDIKCTVGNSKSNFGVKTGVRQECYMSAFFFKLTTDWVMQQATSD